MYFMDRQFIDIENVLSYKTTVDVTKLGSLIGYVRRNADALEQEVNGKIIFTAFESIGDMSRKVLDVEILLPVNKPFKSTDRYVFKPKFKLVNAISARFCGLRTGITSINAEMTRYLAANNLSAISNIYYVDANSRDNADDEIFDAYVSVNENVV